MRIVILNGPNLNLLGQREPEVYGTLSLSAIENGLKKRFPNLEFVFLQSNLEGELVSWLQQFGFTEADKTKGIVINPGGYSHTSVAIADAIAACKVPVVEAHLSNIHAREAYRHQSITGAKAKGILTGFGESSYWLAIEYVSSL